ncbi:MAG: TIGR02147 family protein [Bdellovibrionota bacterium]
MEFQTTLPIPGAQATKPELSVYTDFRQYLKDFFGFKVHLHKDSFGSYTYKNFSAAADIKSPNYLKLIIDGERNLSPATVRKFAKAMALDKRETEEFALLVEYGQAMDPLEKNRHLRRLSEYRMKKKVRTGEVRADAVLNSPNWAAWVLSAMADQKNMSFALDSLREHLQGIIKEDDLRKALEILFKNGSLVRDEQTGEVKKGVAAAPNQEEIPTELIRKLQAELIYLGMESLLYGKPQDREFGSLTVCLTEAEFEKLKFELRHLRKRIYKDALMAREKEKGDRVFQMNIQLFPLTK